MSYAGSGAIALAIDTMLASDNWNPMMKSSRCGTLDLLLSPLNTSANQFALVDQGDGKKRIRRYSWIPRAIESEVSSTASATCETDNEYRKSNFTFEISQVVEWATKINSDYVAQIVDGQDVYIQTVLSQATDAIKRKLNSMVVTTLNSNAGNNITTGAATSTTIEVLDSTNNTVRYGNWANFGNQIVMDNRFGVNPLIVGGKTFNKFRTLAGAGCCNQYGVNQLDVYQSTEYGFFLDDHIATSSGIGTDECLVLEPGWAQLQTYNKYRTLQGRLPEVAGSHGSYRMENGEAKGLLRLTPGLPEMDYKVFYDSCDEVYTLIVSVEFDVLTLPTTLYQSGDLMEGYNGILKYLFTETA